mgnify:CR=1 FL=1
MGAHFVTLIFLTLKKFTTKIFPEIQSQIFHKNCVKNTSVKKIKKILYYNIQENRVKEYKKSVLNLLC